MKIILAIACFTLSFGSLTAQTADKVEQFPNGKTKAIYTASSDNSLSAKFFYQSGQLMEEGSFINEKRDGKWTSYTRSGKVNAIGFYTSGDKSGVWQFWNFDGELSHEVDYTGEKPKMMVYNQE